MSSDEAADQLGLLVVSFNDFVAFAATACSGMASCSCESLRSLDPLNDLSRLFSAIQLKLAGVFAPCLLVLGANNPRKSGCIQGLEWLRVLKIPLFLLSIPGV